MHTNKVHLRVVKDEFNKWYCHANKPSTEFPIRYKLQLNGDTRFGKVFLERCADECDLPNFMQDLDKILAYAEKNKVALFTLYVK